MVKTDGIIEKNVCFFVYFVKKINQKSLWKIM